MTQVVIVGAGPAGIAAACRAAEGGTAVTLIDENALPGGQIWRQGLGSSLDKNARYWLDRLNKSSASVRWGQTVVDIAASEVLVQQEDDALEGIAYDKLILVTGARELFIPFPGWTLPNVMGTGGAQALLKAGMPVEGLRVVVAGSSPLLFAVAGNLAKAGAKIVCIAEQAARLKLARFALGTLRYAPHKMIEGMGYTRHWFGAPYKLNTWIKEARGDAQVREVVLTNGSKEKVVPCDIAACGYGLVPNGELALLVGCEHRGGATLVDELQRTTVDDILCAGELTGVGGVDISITEGEIAGLTAAGNESAARELIPKKTRQLRFVRLLDNCFALKEQLRKLPTDDTIVCRCEDVTYGELKHQTQQRSAKLYTRCGMGPCQGRVCGPALNYLFGWDTNKVRFPVVPTRIGDIVAGVES
jgi:NADPH-dependent 2,4-dienoyl-CoA reductase/sulfur reductase-like enzyme